MKLLSALVAVLSIGHVVAAGEVASLEFELHAAETAFAKSMADRDLKTFSSFLDDETVFSSPTGPLRGKQAVIEAWSVFFNGEHAPFSWQPEEVTVGESGVLGLSFGPVIGPGGKRIGTFNSGWRKDPKLGWKIIFDRGCPACRCPE